MATPQVIALSPLREQISYALQHRGERLLEAADPAAELQALQPLQAYFVFKELGLHQAGPLLRHATPEQLHACIDLDCWPEDQLAIEELDAWLSASAADSPADLAATFEQLDPEVQILFLGRLIQIHPVHSDSDPTVPDALMEHGFYQTPDNCLTLTLRPPPETAEAPEAVELDPTSPDYAPWAEEMEIEPFVLVEALYQRDADAARRLLLAVQWELLGEVEERGYQFRAGRLGDLGFVERAEALTLFARPRRTPPALPPPSAAHAALRTRRSQLPALYADALRAPCLLVAAWNQIDAAAVLERLELELIAVINALVVVEKRGPRDVQAVMALAERAIATLSRGLLALQHPVAAAAADVATARADLLRWPLADIFRHGHAAGRQDGPALPPAAADGPA